MSILVRGCTLDQNTCMTRTGLQNHRFSYCDCNRTTVSRDTKDAKKEKEKKTSTNPSSPIWLPFSLHFGGDGCIESVNTCINMSHKDMRMLVHTQSHTHTHTHTLSLSHKVTHIHTHIHTIRNLRCVRLALAANADPMAAAPSSENLLLLRHKWVSVLLVRSMTAIAPAPSSSPSAPVKINVDSVRLVVRARAKSDTRSALMGLLAKLMDVSTHACISVRHALHVRSEAVHMY